MAVHFLTQGLISRASQLAPAHPSAPCHPGALCHRHRAATSRNYCSIPAPLLPDGAAPHSCARAEGRVIPHPSSCPWEEKGSCSIPSRSSPSPAWRRCCGRSCPSLCLLPAAGTRCIISGRKQLPDLPEVRGSFDQGTAICVLWMGSLRFLQGPCSEERAHFLYPFLPCKAGASQERHIYQSSQSKGLHISRGGWELSDIQ